VQTGHPYLMLDFGLRGKGPPPWLHERLSTGAISYIRARADWTNVFDGVFFTRTMFPTDAAGTIPRKPQ
jgi:hypothetical protein